jgi:hypothetical protein
MGLRLMVVAIVAVVVGSCGMVGSALMLAPAWSAAHGGGVAGTFTLTEAMSCDRYEPPRQRCGWFGDFHGDDGRTVRHRELAGGLPPGARAGDTVAARDAGSPTQIYRAGDTGGWRSPAGFLALFTVVFVIGFAVLRPWRWARLRTFSSTPPPGSGGRRRGSRARRRTGTSP